MSNMEANLIKEPNDLLKSNNNSINRNSNNQDTPGTSTDNNLKRKQQFEKEWCRLCMSEDNLNFCLYDNFNDFIPIIEAIRKCVPLLMIRDTDELSKNICKLCVDNLHSYYKFREMCLKMDRIQKGLPEPKPIIINKQVQKQKLMKPVVKKICPEPPQLKIDKKFPKINADYDYNDEDDYDDDDDNDEHIEEEDEYEQEEVDDNNEDDDDSIENIIIQVQSDNDDDENQKKILFSGDIQLPRGISLKCTNSSNPTEQFTSKTGEYESKVIKGIQNNQFCLVNGYIFDFRLFKGSIRYLKCLSHTCGATGRQNMLDDGTFNSKVIIKSPHNHPPPDSRAMKRQMYLYVIRKKMQTEKTMNFKAVYNEISKNEPDIKACIPLKNVINEVCRTQLNFKKPTIYSFEQLYDTVESDAFQNLHFTLRNQQFFQEKFQSTDGCMALVFANCQTIEEFSKSTLMYVDGSFLIETKENFKYHILTILVWVDDSYYPILFALTNGKSQELYKIIFNYLYSTLAPNLRPNEIVTDYEANIYYALGEVYLNSHIGGSVFYFTQNIYKKICSLNLARELETNSAFRTIYHMLLMLPLLPVNTIIDGLTNIEQQAIELGLTELTGDIFEHVQKEWIEKVTPDLFCVHRLENRINENVIAPFKKLRDFLMISKSKLRRSQITIISIIEKLIELENFLQQIYSLPSKKSFARDLSSGQKKNVIRAWQFIEVHPKININNFFTKVLGYVKCMENQLWIWGFYRFVGDTDDELINANNFSIIETTELINTDHNDYVFPLEKNMLLDVVVDENDGFLKNNLTEDDDEDGPDSIEEEVDKFQSAYLKYVSENDNE